MGGIITNQEELVEILKGLFFDYIEKKRTRQLYQEGKNGLIVPKRLLMFYYQLDEDKRHLNQAAEDFLRHYIACESILEDAHLKYEKEGLKEMYEYLLSDEINDHFDIYTLLDLHKKLFSKAPFPENSGHFRNDNVYLPNTGINLSDWRSIWQEIKVLNSDVQNIIALGEEVKNNPAYLFEYIDRCILLKTQLIQIHPFFDGNGRTIRAFINKLFMDVGLPPIYISSNENLTYRKAMQQAIGEERDYSSIINFYYYKICDSIIELENDYIYGTKKKSSPKTVMKLAQKVKNELSSLPHHYSLDEEISSIIKNYLDEKDITAQIFNIALFDSLLEPHAFVVASYQSGDNKTNKLLIDPLFEMVVTENDIKANKENEAMFENLKDNGVTYANQNELYKYLLIFFEVTSKKLKNAKKHSKN